MDIEDKSEGNSNERNPLYSSVYCVSHAKRRLNELIGIVDDFVNTNPCKSVIEHDANTSEHVLKIKLIKPMPSEIPGIVFDALNNLRSALDHAGFAVSRASGSRGKHSHFPFGDCLNEVIARSKGKGRSRDIPESIFNIMVNCEPYLGGNNALWALNKLCNRNKHEIIIPFVTMSPILTWVVSHNLDPIRWSKRRWDRTKNEMEVARTSFDAKFQDNIELSAQVVFDEVEVVGFRPIDNVLNEMLEAVCSALSAISGEAYKVGLFK